MNGPPSWKNLITVISISFIARVSAVSGQLPVYCSFAFENMAS
jgi:hypothetical protein